MSTPGLGQIFIGGAICMIGLAVTVITAGGASGGGRYVVAWGAILVGGIQMIRGLIAYLNYEPGTDQTQSANAPTMPGSTYQQPGFVVGGEANVSEPGNALIWALASVVRNPDAPSEQEFRAIQSAMIEAGQAAPRKNEIAAIIQAQKADSQLIILQRLRAFAPLLDPQMKTHILRGCFSVMLSDVIQPFAMSAAQKIGNSLGMSPEQVREILGDMTSPLDGKSLQIALSVTPSEAESGKTAEVSYSSLVTCTSCGGMGCTTCSGAGRVLTDRRLIITTPAGLKDGEQLKSSGKGESPLPGGSAGDLYIRVEYA